VPKSETSLADRDSDGIPDKNDALPGNPGPAPAASAAPPPPPPSPTGQTVATGTPSARDIRGGMESRAKDAKEEAKPDVTVTRRAEGYVQPSQPRNVSSLAAVAVQGGTTRYDIPNPITVPDKNATMVMLLARPIPGEAIYLFASDDGVPDSMSHPFHVVRFENVTGGVLERGRSRCFRTARSSARASSSRSPRARSPR